MLRWLTTNIRTFLLAFILALAVWVIAVTSNDPDLTQPYPSPINIDFIGQDPALVLTGSVPRQVDVTLRTPRSIWDTLLSGEVPIRAVVDLTGLSAGDHSVPVQLQINANPIRIVSVSPAKILLTLEPLITLTLPVELSTTGQPAIGYKAGDVIIDPAQVVVSGPQSLVDQVKHIGATLDITNSRQNINASFPITPEASDGSVVTGVSIHPASVQVTLPITQQGGYRDLAVKVIITGKLASGYRLTNITATPLIVTVFSDNLPLIESLPGYVNTLPFDLSGASNTIDTHLALDLPGGVLLIGDQTVAVQIDVVPIEDSRPVSFRSVEIVGLAPGLTAQASPDTVDVILAGPLPVLNSLQPTDVHVRIDVTGLAIGTYQLTPAVMVVEQGVTVQSILPGTVEVIIAKATTPTPGPSPTPTFTPTPTP